MSLLQNVTAANNMKQQHEAQKAENRNKFLCYQYMGRTGNRCTCGQHN